MGDELYCSNTWDLDLLDGYPLQSTSDDNHDSGWISNIPLVPTTPKDDNLSEELLLVSCRTSSPPAPIHNHKNLGNLLRSSQGLESSRPVTPTFDSSCASDPGLSNVIHGPQEHQNDPPSPLPEPVAAASPALTLVCNNTKRKSASIHCGLENQSHITLKQPRSSLERSSVGVDKAHQNTENEESDEVTTSKCVIGSDSQDFVGPDHDQDGTARSYDEESIGQDKSALSCEAEDDFHKDLGLALSCVRLPDSPSNGGHQVSPESKQTSIALTGESTVSTDTSSLAWEDAGSLANVHASNHNSSNATSANTHLRMVASYVHVSYQNHTPAGTVSDRLQPCREKVQNPSCNSLEIDEAIVNGNIDDERSPKTLSACSTAACSTSSTSSTASSTFFSSPCENVSYPQTSNPKVAHVFNSVGSLQCTRALFSSAYVETYMTPFYYAQKRGLRRAFLRMDVNGLRGGGLKKIVVKAEAFVRLSTFKKVANCKQKHNHTKEGALQDEMHWEVGPCLEPYRRNQTRIHGILLEKKSEFHNVPHTQHTHLHSVFMNLTLERQNFSLLLDQGVTEVHLKVCAIYNDGTKDIVPAQTIPVFSKPHCGLHGIKSEPFNEASKKFHAELEMAKAHARGESFA